MGELARVEDQLRRCHEGGAWHGPSLGELLADVSAARASSRPVPGAHTIAELVRHVSAWQDVVVRRLAGEVVIDLPAAQDWPPADDGGEAAWRRTRDELDASYRRLRQAVAGLAEERLAETVPGKGYSVYVMLHGVIQHNLYHAGQIALLKKA
jgi:uncharacterized damage-inducible protein DinB